MNNLHFVGKGFECFDTFLDVLIKEDYVLLFHEFSEKDFALNYVDFEFRIFRFRLVALSRQKRYICSIVYL